MTGAEIIGALLRADAGVVTRVAVANIKGGLLAANAPLPSLLVRTISVIDRQPLKRVGMIRRVDRVSVTARAGSYAEQLAIFRLVRTCCSGKTGDVGGGTRVSILTAGAGPDLIGPGTSFEQAQDFRVSFDAAA